MKIAEHHIMFFFSLLKPDHGFDIWKKKHDMVLVRAIKKNIWCFFFSKIIMMWFFWGKIMMIWFFLKNNHDMVSQKLWFLKTRIFSWYGFKLFFQWDMVTRMAHRAFVSSLFLGSTISKHIYIYSISSNLVCMFYFTMNNRFSEDSYQLLKTVHNWVSGLLLMNGVIL